MRIVSLLLFILFLSFAALQYNDPDPLLWILFYGYVSIIPLLYLFKIFPVKLILFSIIGGLIFSSFYVPGFISWITAGSAGDIIQQMKASKPYIEESREFLGVVIAVLTLLFYYIKGNQAISANAK